MIRRPLPKPGRVEIWCLDGRAGAAHLDPIALDREETDRADRMATEDLKARSRRRRRFLRWGLASYLGVSPEDVPLTAASGGKPALEPNGAFHFNLSHTGEISLLAVGLHPLGIDVEQPKAFDRLGDIVAYTCSSRERAAILSASDPTAAFLDRWVVKEAILKCRGTGLIDELASIDPGPVGRQSVRFDALTVVLTDPPTNAVAGIRLHVALAVDGPTAEAVWLEV